MRWKVQQSSDLAEGEKDVFVQSLVYDVCIIHVYISRHIIRCIIPISV